MRSAKKHSIRALGVAAIAAAAVALAACSGTPSGGGTGGGSGPVTLTLAMLSSNKPGMDQVVEDFHKANPDITVKVNYYESGDAYASAVPPQFAAGNGSDMVQLIGGSASPYSVGAFAKAGYLADLSNAPWVSSMYEPTKELFEVDGKVLAKDFGVSPLAIMSYNKDFFSQNNLTVPNTFDGLLQLCKQISGLGVTPIAWAGASQPVNANNLATIAGNTVFAQDPDWLQQRTDGKTTFADSGWRTALNELQSMIDGGCFSPGAGGTALNDMLTSYGSGQSAMMFTYGGLNGRVLAQAPELSIGMFPFPAPNPSDTRITVQSAGGIAVWNGSKNKDAANTFLSYLSKDDVAAAFAQSNQLISTPQATSGNLPEVYSELKTFFTTPGMIIPDVTARWPSTQMNTQIGASVQGLFTGQKTVDQVLGDMDSFFNDATK